MPNLPDEIVFNILTRLPVVSLCRFRCVSKPWRSLISHPHFIQTHFAYNKHERVILSYDDGLYSVGFESSQFGDGSVQALLKFPPEKYQFFDGIYGSCDGLLLIGLWRAYSRWLDHYLVNPSTREFRKLPPSPSKASDHFKCSNRYGCGYGFGYDTWSKDYKVVSISHSDAVSVYSLRTNSWKKIEESNYDLSMLAHKSGVLVSGALHWIAEFAEYDLTGRTIDIIALDLADDKFRTVPPLDCMDNELAVLAVLGGCLFVSGKQYNDNHADFWVMKEYGVGDSWTKFTVTVDSFYDSWKPLSSSRAGQVLFEVNCKKLVLFDPQEEKSKELVVHGLPIYFVAGTYVESLVSPERQC